MNVDMLSKKLSNDCIIYSNLCSRFIMAAPNNYLPILQEVIKERKKNLTLDHLEEEIKEAYSLGNLVKIDEESNDDNEATDIALITPVDGRNGRLKLE